MTSLMTDHSLVQLLNSLYADSAKIDPEMRKAAKEAEEKTGEAIGFYMKNAYMPVSFEFGKLLYTLVRASKAKTIVEFGTSFGVSTIFLAAALRDNGGSGKLITNEFHGEKSARARKNLEVAGLAHLVDFRIGDIRETMKQTPAEIDFVFLDGAKDLYLEVLKMLEPGLISGAVITSDNTDHDGLEAFLQYLRTPANGYVSSALSTFKNERHMGHEVSFRC